MTIHPTSLPASPGSARRARQLLVTALREAGREDAVDHGLAELLVSELATNAIRYGGGASFRLLVAVEAEHVLVEVEDASSQDPRPRHALPAEEGGRGLDLVRVLASSWGWRPSDGPGDGGGPGGAGGGKVVWFRLALDRRP